MDARQLFRLHRRGIGKTLAEMYATLARLKPDWQFHLVHQVNAPGPEALRDLPNVHPMQVDIPAGDRLGLWEAVRLPLAAVMHKASVLHCPANTGPRFPLQPMVLTIHDLIPLELAPDDPATRKWLQAVRTAARSARHITTVSTYSQQQIVQHLGIPAERVTAIGHAPDRQMRIITDPADLDRVRGKYGLNAGEAYVLAFGAADPRKNTDGLIAAYAQLPDTLRDRYRLLVVGIQGPALATFQQQVATLGLTGRVLLHGYAEEADLPALLNAATVLGFPSKSEGFGLPILDAFACNLPVLTSDRTSLPEVAGDAAELVNPDNNSSIRAGLERLLADADHRETLRTRGRSRLQLFQWETAAEAYAQVFAQVAGRAS